MAKQIRPALETWKYLGQETNFQQFMKELVVYLQKNLLQVPRFPDTPNSEQLWLCPENYMKIMKGCGDRNFEWAMYSKRFCEERNFYWPEVRDMIEEELDCVVTCDCQILQGEEYRVQESNSNMG